MAEFTLNIEESSFEVKQLPGIVTDCSTTFLFELTATVGNSVRISLDNAIQTSLNFNNATFTFEGLEVEWDGADKVFTYSSPIYFSYSIANSGTPGSFKKVKAEAWDDTTTENYNYWYQITERTNDNLPCDNPTGGILTYDELTDTPENKIGSALKLIRVNAAEDAHEYVDVVSSQWVDVVGGIEYLAGDVTAGNDFYVVGDAFIADEMQVDGGIRSTFYNKIGGLPTEFLKADGSVDSNTYLTSADVTSSQWSDILGGINYAGGKVGVGVTAPIEQFEVNGGIVGKTIFIENAGNFRAKLISDGLTFNRTFTFPNNEGTLALTSDIPSASQWDNVTGGINYANGNVGIGTTSPNQKLQVQGGGVQFITTDDNQRLFITSSQSSQSIIYFGDTSSSTKGRVVYENLSDSMFFSTDNSEKMRILVNGNVGIGTSSPGEKLHVNGNLELGDTPTLYWTSNTLNLESKSSTIRPVVNIKGNVNYGGRLNVEDEFGSTAVRLRGDGNSYFNRGNLGIGTTSPSVKLHVNGDARLSGAFYDSDNLPGTAGKVLSSTGSKTSWIEPSSVITRLIPHFQTATPGGSDTYTQSNNAVDFDWSGGSGTYVYILPSATAIPYRTIRFVNNSTIVASDKIHITAPIGETIDGVAFYEINKPYNGCAVWSDGVQWVVIQAKG